MNFDRNNKPTGLRRIYLAFGHSIRALRWLVKNESAFRQELAGLLASVVIICVWDISVYERAALLCAVLLVMLAEIMNTAIEVVVDRVSKEIHPLSGLAKDLASAAVLLAAVICGLIWAAVIYQHY